MRVAGHLSSVLLFVFLGCATVPRPVVKPELLTGSWRLVRTVYNGVSRSHSRGDLLYRFYASGKLVSRIRSEVFTGRGKAGKDRLHAWWPGRHRESHRVAEHTRQHLTLVSRDGRLVSHFVRIP